MSKSAITTIFVGGALVFIAGLVLAVRRHNQKDEDND